jgi:hypothetical protein
VLAEGGEVVVLESVHGLPVQLLYALPDLPVGLVVVREIELLAPVAEV